ncbi:calponin-3-like [Cebus imitator]|uniref:calponin-3-like n=1 Tax=Cebus imitator TaxID=2715852 RepID=UPI001899A3FD|nr:calponin-3-like [Cebus imitator]
MSIGTNFQLGLKDGIIFCELRNKLQPGSVKVNESSLNWPQLENIGDFIKAIQAYGMKPHDILEANDLSETGNMTQVQMTLMALAGLAKTKGFHATTDVGVKYAETQTRRFDEGKLKAGQSVIGLQMGTKKCASQAGMTAYGTRRHLYDPKMQSDKPSDQTTVSLQMGTNKGASQAGMLAPGTRSDICDLKLILQPVDNSTISLQTGTNKVASQKGMSVYGLGQQVYDPKYCAAPTEPVIHNESQGTGTNGSEISDSGY